MLLVAVLLEEQAEVQQGLAQDAPGAEDQRGEKTAHPAVAVEERMDRLELGMDKRATDTTARIVQMIERDRQRIGQVGRGAGSALRVHQLAVRSVVINPRLAAAHTELSDPLIYAAIRRLEGLGVLREVTGRQRGRIWVYGEYLDLLNEGTEHASQPVAATQRRGRDSNPG